MIGFIESRKLFGEMFDSVRTELDVFIDTSLDKRTRVKVGDINKAVDDALMSRDVQNVFDSTAREVVETKIIPKFTEPPTRTKQAEQFMRSWKSYDKTFTNRLKNSYQLIRNEYKKSTKRIYNDTRNALLSGDPHAKIYGKGLTRPVQKKYRDMLKKSPERAGIFYETEIKKLASKMGDQKLMKLQRHYATRVVETEALTMRMQLELQNQPNKSKIDYIRISVKPKACQICESFRGVKYPFGQHPHLLAHPSCRCDYVVVYKNKKRVVIPGSGRVDLLPKRKT
jgi:hypothetical protein